MHAQRLLRGANVGRDGAGGLPHVIGEGRSDGHPRRAQVLEEVVLVQGRAPAAGAGKMAGLSTGAGSMVSVAARVGAAVAADEPVPPPIGAHAAARAALGARSGAGGGRAAVAGANPAAQRVDRIRDDVRGPRRRRSRAVVRGGARPGWRERGGR